MNTGTATGTAGTSATASHNLEGVRSNEGKDIRSKVGSWLGYLNLGGLVGVGTAIPTYEFQS